MVRNLIAYGSLIVIAYIIYAFTTRTPEVEVLPLPEPEVIQEVIPPLIEAQSGEDLPIPEPEEVFYSEREIECLALNSYYESRGESKAGQVAVAQVVINRLKNERFPNTICGVVQQGPTYKNWKGNIMPVRHQCHFSWWCDGKSDIPVDLETYEEILNLVTDILYLDTVDITDGSLYYHAEYVNPWWAPHFEMVTKIDRHIFYR